MYTAMVNFYLSVLQVEVNAAGLKIPSSMDFLVVSYLTSTDSSLVTTVRFNYQPGLI